MSKQFTPLTMAFAGVAVNAVYQVRHGRDPVPVIFLGSLWVGAVVLVSQVQPELGTAIAAVYLLSVLLTRGTEFFDWINDLASGMDASKNKRKKKNHG